MTLAEIRARQAEILAELEAIASRSEALDTDAARTDELLDEHERLDADAAPLEARSQRLDAVRRAAAAAVPAQRAAGAPPAAVERTGTRGTVGDPTVVVRTQRDPFDVDFRAMRNGRIPQREIRERALDAIEAQTRNDSDEGPRLTDAQAEHATALLNGRAQNIGPRSRAALAAHVLRTGSDDYHESFREYVEDPEGNFARAALSLTSANGGFLVPFTLDPTIILTNAGSANPWRRLATTKTTATNNWNGVTSAGVNAAWLAEAAVVTDNSPTFGNIQITPQKAAAWVFGSYEVLEDSDFASSFTGLMVDARDRLEEAAFATGTGTGQPWGAVTRATTVASAAVATYAVADVYAVLAAMPARFRGPMSRLAWVAALGIMNRTRQFDTAGGSSFWANLGAGTPEQLLGAPIYESTTMVSTITTGSKNLLLGDWSQYYVVDRIGMSVIYDPLVKDSATARPTGQAGWYAFWRTGGDVTTTAAFRVLTEA